MAILNVFFPFVFFKWIETKTLIVVKNEVKQMRIKLSVAFNLMLFYKSMACAGYLREIIIFTVKFHIVCISYCKIIKPIDDNL